MATQNIQLSNVENIIFDGQQVNKLVLNGNMIWQSDVTPPDVPNPFTNTPTKDTTPTWTWSSIQDAIVYGVKLNNNSEIETSSTSFTPSSPLSQGNHTLQVRAKDNANNWSAYGTHTITIDTTAPAVPSPTSQTPTNDITPTWTWSPISGAVSYRVRLNGTLQGDVSTTSYTSSNLPQGTHTIQVASVDGAGNVSAYGSHTIIIDTTAPGIPSPTTQTPTNDTTPTWTWSPISGATSYRMRLDGALQGNTSSTSYTPPVLSTGSHTFSVASIDSAGNTSPYGSHTVFIDTTPAGLPNPSTATPTNDNTPTWNWPAVSGASSYSLKLDGVSKGTTTSTSYTAPPLSDGNHTLQVASIDSAGNMSSYKSHTVTIDTIAQGVPSPSTSTPTNDNTPTWTWSAISGALGYSLKLDGVSKGTTSSTSYTSTQLSPGNHTFQVASVDRAGNVSAFGSHVVKIDTSAPSIPVFLDSNKKFYQTRRPKIEWSESTDPNCTGENCVTYDVALGFEGEAPWEESLYNQWSPDVNLDDGFYNLSVRAKDSAGNVSDVVVYGFWIDNVAPPNIEFSSWSSEYQNTTKPTWRFNKSWDTDYVECKLNNGAIFIIDWGTRYTPTEPLDPSIPHTLHIRGCDEAGNKSAWTSYTINIDLDMPIAPVITVASPTTDLTPTWYWTSSADAIEYGVKLGNDPWVSEQYIEETNYTPTSNLSTGWHTLYVRAKDRANNWSSTSSKSVYIIASSSPPTGDPSPNFTPSSVSISAIESYNFKPTITWSSVSGAVRYELQVNGGSWISVTGNSYKLETPITLGANKVAVRAVDSAGNKGTPRENTWNVQTPNKPEILELDCLDKTANSWQFDWASATGAIEYEYRINNSSPTKINDTIYNFTNLSPGDYKAEVRSHGGAGNYSNWSSVFFTLRNQIDVLTKSPMVMPVTVDSTDKTVTLYLSRDTCGGKFGINWGDGTYEEEESSTWANGSKHHTYANAGSYEIKVYAETGVLYRVLPNYQNDSKFKIKGVSSWGDLGLTSLHSQFAEGDVQNMVIPSNIPSTVRSISSAFKSVIYPSDTYSWNYTTTSNYKVFDAIKSWNVSNIKSMDWCFYDNEFFDTDISGWNVSNCNDFALMFADCEVFDQNLSSWNINTSEPVDMHGMFKYCKKFNNPIGNWNMSQVTRTSHMFYMTKRFNQNLSPWNTRNITSMKWMFSYARDFNNAGSSAIGNWNVTSCENFDLMFKETNMDQNLSNWCVSHISSTPSSFATDSPLGNNSNKHPKWGQPC